MQTYSSLVIGFDQIYGTNNQIYSKLTVIVITEFLQGMSCKSGLYALDNNGFERPIIIDNPLLDYYSSEHDDNDVLSVG